MTWPATAISVTAEITTYFPELLPTSLDFQRALGLSLFLSSADAVTGALVVLENRLAMRALQLTPADFNLLSPAKLLDKQKSLAKQSAAHYQGWQARQAKRDAGKKVSKGKFSHLLTSEMAAIERDAGFAVFVNPNDHADTSHKAMLMMPLGLEKFRENLQAGRHWKDIVGVAHGEYTHRLQWTLFCLAHPEHVPVDLFKLMGRLTPHDAGGKKYTLWDCTCDRSSPGSFGPTWPFDAEDNLDFRSPEKLLTWLCNQQVQFPLVAGFLKHRRDKREHQQDIGYGANNYIALKVFKQPWDLLTADQQNAIDAYLLDGTSDDATSVAANVGLLKPTTHGYTHPAFDQHR
jgi:hypothetical protein